MPNFKKLARNYEKNAILALQELVKIDSTFDPKTVSPNTPYGKGVDRALDALLKLSKEHGFKVEKTLNRCAEVSFGDNVFIAPNCCFTTAEHPTDPELRRAGVEVAKPIKVGNNVWIGAGSTVLAGVTIGDDAVIGAGSVVTSDIPPRVVACGVPCRVTREITSADRTRYPMHESIARRF